MFQFGSDWGWRMPQKRQSNRVWSTRQQHRPAGLAWPVSLYLWTCNYFLSDLFAGIGHDHDEEEDEGRKSINRMHPWSILNLDSDWVDSELSWVGIKEQKCWNKELKTFFISIIDFLFGVDLACLSLELTDRPAARPDRQAHGMGWQAVEPTEWSTDSIRLDSDLNQMPSG